MVMVPAPFTKDAILEAYEAGIETIVAITEGVPVHDMTEVYDTVVRERRRAPHRPELPRPDQPRQVQRRDHPAPTSPCRARSGLVSPLRAR